MAGKRHTDAGEAAGVGSKTLEEFGEGVIKLSEGFVPSEAEAEIFANQILTIVVAKDGTQGAYDVITPMVGGINQPIIRGMRQEVKRKYVESLARSRVTNYEQLSPDPSKPENFLMRDITVLTYPFSVLHDPHPDGDSWLQAIVDQA